MSYKKLNSEDTSPSKSLNKSPISSPSPSKSKLSPLKKKPSSKAETSASIKSQLEERKNSLKAQSNLDTNTNILEISPDTDTESNTSPYKPHTQSDLDHDLAVAISRREEKESELHDPYAVPIHKKTTMSSMDDQYIADNPINNNQNIESYPDPDLDGLYPKFNKCGKSGRNGLCILWSRDDKITLIGTPILFFLLLFIMIVFNPSLIMVWFLSGLSFYCILIYAYFYGYPENEASDNYMNRDSILDLFSISMFYGGMMSSIGYIFTWLLAGSNNILLGPFIFSPSGYYGSSESNMIMYTITACLMYGGIFPFCLIWMKADKRLFDRCVFTECKLKNVSILDEFEALQETLNLPQAQLDQFMAMHEQGIINKLQIAQKRLIMECVSASVGYYGGIYILAMILKFTGMGVADSTLIFLMGYLGKDFIFAIMIGILSGYVIGRERLYGITMSSKWCGYLLIVLLGVLQQVPSSILCGLYPSIIYRMYIIYVAIGVNLFICIVALFEILRQRKLLKAQCDFLFVYNSINKQINNMNNPGDESSVRMDNLSVQYIDISANVRGQ